MNAGKVIGVGLVVMGLVTGVVMYWLQEYAYYTEVAFPNGDEIRLTLIDGGTAEPILASGITGIDANSSPLRFRACFTTQMGLPLLTETYKSYEGAEPLNAPDWFDCFDAEAIGKALESGEALAFLSEANIQPQVDRVVAVFPDGRAFAWHQFSPDAEQ